MFSVSQDVLYPVEAVILAGGYVVHQVTAADNLKTGDQVQLHLDQVNTKQKHICGLISRICEAGHIESAQQYKTVSSAKRWIHR